MSHHISWRNGAREWRYSLVIAGILYIGCWKVLSWAIILVAKSARGDCETALASLLGFLIGFVIADLCRVKAARERIWALVYKIQSFRLWPSSQGQSVHSCSLWRRWPGFGSLSVLLPADHPSPTTTTTHPSSSSSRPSCSLLSSQRSFSTPSLSFLPPPPPSSSQHPSAWPSRESLILSALQISTLFRRGMPTPLQRLHFGIVTPPTNTH